MVGAGYIGLELGMAFAKLGAKVTVVEADERILPAYDAELTRPVLRGMRASGVEVLTGTAAAACQRDAALRVARPGGAERAASRPTRSWSPSAAAAHRGFGPGTARPGHERRRSSASTSAARPRCATSGRSATSTGEPMLAHRAMAQGEMVAEIIAGQRRAFEPMAIPRSASPIRRSFRSACRRRRRAAARHEVGPGQFPSPPTAAP